MSAYVIAPDEDGGRIFLQAAAPDAVQQIVNGFIREHSAEIDELLEGTGYHLADLMQPVWMRAVRADEIEFAGTDVDIRNAAGDVIRTVTAEIEQRRKFREHKFPRQS